jgi:trimeric autotransporter adhesin
VADTEGLFAGGQHVYINDKMLGTINPIDTSAYVFTSESGTFNNRFEIVYTNSALETGGNPAYTQDKFIVYKSAGILYLNAYDETIKDVKVFDITGKLLYNNAGINLSEIKINNLTAQEQMLIVRTTFTTGVTIDKKIIY